MSQLQNENADAPAGCEGFPSNAALARRLLITPTHAGRLLASRELAPRRLGKSLVFYASADLDTIRLRAFSSLVEKAKQTNASEREQMQAALAFASALQAGREQPNFADRAAGASVGEAEYNAKAIAEFRATLGKILAALPGLEALVNARKLS